MKALYLTRQVQNVDELHIACIERPYPKPKAGEAIVQIASSGVNIGTGS